MRILLCSSTYLQMTHGPAKFTRLVLHSAKDFENIEIKLLTRDIDAVHGSNIYQIKGWYPRYLGVFWEYFDNIKHYRAIKRISREWKPDTIIFVDAVLGYLTSLILKDYFVIIGLVNDYEYALNTWSNRSYSKDWFVKWKSRFLERKAARNMHCVIANSKFLQDVLVQQYCLDVKKVKILYKGIDFTNFEFKQNRQIDLTSEIKVLFVKSDFKRGGLYQLICALSALDCYKFKLYICGPDQSDQEDILKDLPMTNNLRLVFEGKASQPRIKKLLSTCDVFCVPALREALGVANIEALAAGIPVVSTNSGGIPEVLDQGLGGWLCPPGDIEKLSETIEICLAHEELRKQKSKKGRALVEKKFSHQKMLNSLFLIIDQTFDKCKI